MSGNLSFLNWLTIVPSLACFDDASLGFLFGTRGGAGKEVLDLQHEDAAVQTPKPSKGKGGSSSSHGSSIFHLLTDQRSFCLFTYTQYGQKWRKFIFKAKRWTCLFLFFRRTNNNKDVLCVFNYCRYADAPRGEHFSGHSDWIPEHSRGDEPAEFQAANEHLFRPAAHRQHLRGFWKVRSGGTGFNIVLASPPPTPSTPAVWSFVWKHHQGTDRGDFPGNPEPGSQGPQGSLGGVPVPLQTGRCLPPTVCHIAVPLSTGLADVVRCLPGEFQQQSTK